MIGRGKEVGKRREKGRGEERGGQNEVKNNEVSPKLGGLVTNERVTRHVRVWKIEKFR